MAKMFKKYINLEIGNRQEVAQSKNSLSFWESNKNHHAAKSSFAPQVCKSTEFKQVIRASLKYSVWRASSERYSLRNGDILDSGFKVIKQIVYMEPARQMSEDYLLLFGGRLVNYAVNPFRVILLNVSSFAQCGQLLVFSNSDGLFCYDVEANEQECLSTEIQDAQNIIVARDLIYANTDYQVIQITRDEGCKITKSKYRIFSMCIFHSQLVVGTENSLFKLATQQHIFCFSNSVIQLLPTQDILFAFQPRRALIFNQKLQLVKVIDFEHSYKCYQLINGGFRACGKQIHDFVIASDEQ